MKPPQPTVLAHNVQQFSAVCSFEEPDAVPRPEFDVPLSSVFSSGGSKPSIAQWVGGGGAGYGRQLQTSGYSLATCASAAGLVRPWLFITQLTREPHELPAAIWE